MFGISPSEKCEILSSQWYDKGFIRVSFKAGSEVLTIFIKEEEDFDTYERVLIRVCQNLVHVFDLEPPEGQLTKQEYLIYLAEELSSKKGTECRVKVGLSKVGNKFIILPKYSFSTFISKVEEGHKLSYSDYEKENYGNPEKLVKSSDFPTLDDEHTFEEELFIEDFNMPKF